jgi:hypothetical protein
MAGATAEYPEAELKQSRKGGLESLDDSGNLESTTLAIPRNGRRCTAIS